MKKLINITEKTVVGTIWEVNGFSLLICAYYGTNGVEFYTINLNDSLIDDMFFAFRDLERYLMQPNIQFVGHINELDVDSYLVEKLPKTGIFKATWT